VYWFCDIGVVVELVDFSSDGLIHVTVLLATLELGVDRVSRFFRLLYDMTRLNSCLLILTISRLRDTMTKHDVAAPNDS
jgi:hypothetical protein